MTRIARSRSKTMTETLPSNPRLGDTVRWFKTMTTNDYIREVRRHGFPPYS